MSGELLAESQDVIRVSDLPRLQQLTGNEILVGDSDGVTVGIVVQQVAALGEQGNGGTGWWPLFALPSDGDRIVLQILDWSGGTGNKPGIGYIGASGLVQNIAQGVNVRGLQGNPGADGHTPVGTPGAGAPGPGTGANGDIYLNSTNGDFYSKNAGTWVLLGNLKGPQGEDGGGGQASAFSPINIVSYGAIGDGRERITGSIAAGSTTLTVSGAGFNSFDIGKKVFVDNAGVGGADLIAEILSVISSTQVQISTAAGTTVIGARTLWGTDNGPRMTSLIQSKQSPYNQISFLVPRGHYLTFSEISIPASTVAGAKSISFTGETFGTQWFGTVSEDPLNHDGSIIQCLSQTPGDAIFKFEAGTGDYYGVSLIHPVFEKLNLRTYDQPMIDGVNAYAASHLIMRDVDVTTGVFSVIAKEPSPTPYDANGVRTPKIDNGALTILDNVSVSGFWCGIEVNEHTQGSYINLTCNYYGMNFKTAGHASNFTRVNSQRNHRGLNWAGLHLVTIQCFNIEHAGPGQTTADNAWQATDYDLYDPQNFARGEISYAVMTGGVGQGNTFTMFGGAYIEPKYLGGGGVTPSLPTPATPTNGVADDVNNTYDWTNTPGHTSVSSYEYTLNAGASYTTASAKPIVVGDVSKGIGQVGVRLKAVDGVSQASGTLYNTTAFTASGTPPPTGTLVYPLLQNFSEVSAGQWQEGGSTGGGIATQNWGVATSQAIPAATDLLMYSTLASSSNNGIILGIDNSATGNAALTGAGDANWKLSVSASENVVVFWEYANGQLTNTSVTLPFGSNSLYGIRVAWSGGVATSEAIYSVNGGTTWQVARTYLTALSPTETLYCKMGATIAGRINLNPKLFVS